VVRIFDNQRDLREIDMAVRCARCGEELLGAVNRCWKCGQQFAVRPTPDGLPPVRAELVAETVGVAAASNEQPADAPIEARLIDESAAAGGQVTSVLEPRPTITAAIPPPLVSTHPLATPRQPKPVASPANNVAALGGADAALLLGLFGLLLSWWRYEGAIVAFIGLVAGIWGIYSPRRGWALVGMLLCALAMGLGTYTGVRQLYLYLNRNAPIEAPLPDEEVP
jgi:hypothetical protein